MNQRNQFANAKLERILLGALILNNAFYFTIDGSIRSDAFTVPLHRQMFETLVDMIDAGQATTIPLLCAKLPEEEADENKNGVSVRSYISVCVEQAGETSGAIDVAETVAELAAMRRLLRVAEETVKAVGKGDLRSDEIAGNLEAQASDIINVSNPKRPIRLSVLSKGVIANARVARDTGKVAGFKTGLATIDELIGLMLPGDLGVILASQSDGKTALARQIGKFVSLSAPVLEIQLEMSAQQVAERDVATASNLPVGDIQEGRVGAFDFQAVEDAATVINSYDYYVHDASKMTVRQIRGIALAMKRTRGLGLLLIDQFDKIRTERHIPNKFDRGAEISADLKALAKELGIPVIVLAQRTRMAQRGEEVPDVNDAEFPSLEKDADWFLGLWRRETWLQKQEPPKDNEIKHGHWEDEVRAAASRADVVSLKRRRGRRFVRRQMRWRGEITQFEDM